MRSNLGIISAAAGQHSDVIGTSWSQVANTGYGYSRVASGANGTTIATTGGSKFSRSRDIGATWSDINSPNAALTFNSIATDGAGGWVVGSNPGNLIYYSTDDGDSWSLGLHTNPVNSQWYHAAYGNGVFVIVDGNRSASFHSCVYSTDGGANWTSTTGEANADCYGITFDGTNFIIGQDSAVSTSPDGITFTSRTESTADIWIGTASNTSNVVFVGLSHKSMHSSNHGVSWTTGGTGLPANTFRSAAYATNGEVHCVSSDGTNRAYKSTDDGVNFSSVSGAPSETWYDVCAVGVHLVAVSDSGKIMRI